MLNVGVWMVWQNIRQLITLNLLILEILEAEFSETMKIRTFTKARSGKARKSLAIFSGLILKIVIKVRKLIFKLCLPKYITIDLNQLPPPKKVYL